MKGAPAVVQLDHAPEVAHAASYIARFPPLGSGTFGNDARKPTIGKAVSLKGEERLRGLTVDFPKTVRAALCVPVVKLLLRCLRDLR